MSSKFTPPDAGTGPGVPGSVRTRVRLDDLDRAANEVRRHTTRYLAEELVFAEQHDGFVPDRAVTPLQALLISLCSMIEAEGGREDTSFSEGESDGLVYALMTYIEERGDQHWMNTPALYAEARERVAGREHAPPPDGIITATAGRGFRFFAAFGQVFANNGYHDRVMGGVL